PLQTPCGHNFCLKCFQKWVGQGKLTCAKCRSSIPAKMASQPRINSALVVAIRMAKTAKSNNSNGPTHVYHFMRNENRPDKAFTTERAKKAGKANACSGQIFVTVPPDHFGPILAENDPKRNRGVLVGELWEDRMECRQWGAHLPHVAGIAGQSDYGAQSVALSGGYEDDEDHGEWFLYTGSGGRDLSGNKRTNKEQSFDQKFEKLNQALRVSCLKGYPVRVVSQGETLSYALNLRGSSLPVSFCRCDNEPAPWTVRNMVIVQDLCCYKRTEKCNRHHREKGNPHGTLMKRTLEMDEAPPVSRKPLLPETRRWKESSEGAKACSKLIKFSCLICRKVMTSPLTTPCAHNFCKTCLLGVFANQSFVRERSREGGRALRAQKIAMKCPACPNDISDFLQNPQVNREMMDLIESLQRKTEEENVEEQQQSEEGGSDGEEKSAEDEDNIAEEKQPAEGESKNTEADADIETTDSVDEKSFPKTNLESGKGEATKEPNEVSGRGSPIVCFKRKKALAAGPSGKKRPKTCEFRNISAEDSMLADKKPDEDADNSETVNNGEETKVEAVNAESPSSPFSVPADDDSSQ
ncbi:E3 ubiquitin-protein ligase ORTHRUS 2, partial [Ananas comosus]